MWCVLGFFFGNFFMKVFVLLMYNVLGEVDGEEGFILVYYIMWRVMFVFGVSVYWYEKLEIWK